MIIFEKIKYKNILSVGNQFIEIDLAGHDKTLITGKNGQGKSLLADALCFALYGKAFRKIKKDQMVNSVNKKKLVVELEFSIGPNKYKIIRGVAPSVFKVYINGKLKNQDASVKDYQSYLEQYILGMSEKTFRQIVILGSTAFVPFMKLNTGDRRAVVENLLDIQIFSFMNQIIKGRVSTLTTAFDEIQNQLSILNNSLHLKETHLEELREKDASKVEENNTLISEYAARIDSAGADIIKAQGLINTLMSEIGDETVLRGKLSKLQGFKGTITNNVKKLNKDIAFFENNDVCPTCTQDITQDIKDSHIKDRNDKIENVSAGLSELESEIGKIETSLTQVTDALREVAEHEKLITELRSTNNHLEESIQRLENENASMQEENDTADKEKDIEDIKTQIEELVGKRDELVKKGNYFAVLSEMIKDGGIKTKIIKTYIPVINILIKKYLGVLDFPVDFSFDESFSETIKSRNRDIFSYANFSEGEKLRIDLCLLFTWREVARLKNSASTNLILFDEIGSNSLDVDGLDAFMRIISKEEKQNVFVISHNAAINDKFSKILHFEKKGYFTQLIEA